MTQPGHATDIYDDRYPGQALNTAYAPQSERPGDGAYQTESFELGDATADFYVTAPFAGKLVRAEVNPLTTTDGSNGIELTATNESNSDAEMFTVDYDDDPVATKEVVNAVTLSTTAASLLVDQGDLIKVVYTETGTIAGGVVSLYFENF